MTATATTDENIATGIEVTAESDHLVVAKGTLMTTGLANGIVATTDTRGTMDIAMEGQIDPQKVDRGMIETTEKTIGGIAHHLVQAPVVALDHPPLSANARHMMILNPKKHDKLLYRQCLQMHSPSNHLGLHGWRHWRRRKRPSKKGRK